MIFFRCSSNAAIAELLAVEAVGPPVDIAEVEDGSEDDRGMETGVELPSMETDAVTPVGLIITDV